METIKYSYNSNSKPHKWSVISASSPQRENKALCPLTNRWRFHGSCELQVNSPHFLCPHFKKGGEKLEARVHRVSQNKHGDPETLAQSDAWTLEGGERARPASSLRCSQKMLCGMRSPLSFKGLREFSAISLHQVAWLIALIAFWMSKRPWAHFLESQTEIVCKVVHKRSYMWSSKLPRNIWKCFLFFFQYDYLLICGLAKEEREP